jgi:hypothetical protein
MQLASHEFAKRQLKGSQQSNNLASHYSPEILPFKINHDQSMPCRRDVAEITAKLLKLGQGPDALSEVRRAEVTVWLEVPNQPIARCAARNDEAAN